MAMGTSQGAQDQILNSLYEAFQNIDKDTIKATAISCNFNIDEIGDSLLNMNTPNLNININNDKNISDHIERGHKVMILMRGLPGSGKSTLARSILENSLGKVNRDEFIFSTSDYFWQTGDYSYDVDELDQADKWNRIRCGESMKRGVSPIIIDNNNLVLEDMKVYCSMAANFGYIVEIAEPQTPWALDPEILAEQNTNGITESEIRDMFERFQMYLSPKNLNDEFNFTYQGRIPQMRKYPSFEKLVEGERRVVTSSIENASSNRSNEAPSPVTPKITKLQPSQNSNDKTTSPNSTPINQDMSRLLEKYTRFKKNLEIQMSSYADEAETSAAANKLQGSTNTQQSNSTNRQSQDQTEGLHSLGHEDMMYKMMEQLTEIQKQIQNINTKMTPTNQKFRKSDDDLTMEELTEIENQTTPNLAASYLDNNGRILDFINKGYKIMILMRGLPGSGKSYLASSIVKNSYGNIDPEDFILSCNDIFFDTELTNVSEMNNLAIGRIQRKCFTCINRGVSPIIIDNNNLSLEEMRVFCVMAAEFGYMIEIVQTETPWAFDVSELAERNVLGLERHQIKDMRANYHKNISVGDLYKSFNLKCLDFPQFRKYPPFVDLVREVDED